MNYFCHFDFSGREDIQEKYEGKLNKVMSGPEYEIISRIMKTLVQRKITVPGSFIG
jgi:structure-specific recognition protein 1